MNGKSECLRLIHGMKTKRRKFMDKTVVLAISAVLGLSAEVRSGDFAEAVMEVALSG